MPSSGFFASSRITKISKFSYLFENSTWYPQSLKNMLEGIIKDRVKFITLLLTVFKYHKGAETERKFSCFSCDSRQDPKRSLPSRLWVLWRLTLPFCVSHLRHCINLKKAQERVPVRFLLRKQLLVF